ncbi:MAG: hypothetical protein J5I93_12315, partial [Pirellulaceae bacterium]|nr:hypothetical protein [Pirellulaceae bacterium]
MTHLGLAIALQLLAPAHVLPDGVVERGVQVTAYDDQLEIRYLVGLNDATLALKLAELLPDQTPPIDPQQALDLYRQRILSELASGLTVLLDDQPQTIQPVETRRGTLHHVQLECVYHVPLPPGGQLMRLELLDRNFAADPGNHRMAAKGRGDVQLDDCSVPPILARVPLLAFDQLPAATAAESRRVEATIRRPGAAPAAVLPVAEVERAAADEPLAATEP